MSNLRWWVLLIIITDWFTILCVFTSHSISCTVQATQFRSLKQVWVKWCSQIISATNPTEISRWYLFLQMSVKSASSMLKSPAYVCHSLIFSRYVHQSKNSRFSSIVFTCTKRRQLLWLRAIFELTWAWLMGWALGPGLVI